MGHRRVRLLRERVRLRVQGISNLHITLSTTVDWELTMSRLKSFVAKYGRPANV